MSTTVFFATVFLAAVGIASSASPLETILGQQTISSPVMNLPASCYDSKLTDIFNRGLAAYKQNMGKLSEYVLNQIKLVRYGHWLVHAQMIGRQQAHFEWESVTNGDISNSGCCYNDGVTYIVAIMY
jgi:hypothetical protein